MTPRTALSGETFGARLRDARNKKGLSLARATFLAQSRLGFEAVSREAIRKWETDQVSEDTVDVLGVAFLAWLYEVKLEDLSPRVAERINTISELAKATMAWLPITAA